MYLHQVRRGLELGCCAADADADADADTDTDTDTDSCVCVVEGRQAFQAKVFEAVGEPR